MSKNNPNYPEMLATSIKAGNHNRLRSLIDSFPEQNRSDQIDALTGISISPDNLAYSMLEILEKQIMEDQDVHGKFCSILLERAHANAGFILIFIQTANEEMLTGAAPLMNHILQTSTDPFILLNTLTALGKIRTETYISTIADFIYYNSKELMTAAVNALAKIGTAEAFSYLWQASIGSKSNEYIISILSREHINIKGVKNSDKSMTNHLQKAVELLITMLNSKHPSIRLSATEQLIRIGDPAIATLCLKLDRNSENAACILHILGIIGDENTLNKIYSFVRLRIEAPNLRYALFKAAADLSFTKMTDRLKSGIDDKVEYVSTAAVAALDSIVCRETIMELKAIIETGGSAAENTVGKIINSRAGNLFTALLSSDSFTHIASYYLQTKTPPSTREFFTGILKSRGKLILAKQIQNHIEGDRKNNGPVISVIGREKPLQGYILKIFFDMGLTTVEFDSIDKMLLDAEDFTPSLIIATDKNKELLSSKALTTIQKKYSGIKPPVLLFSLCKNNIETQKGIITRQMPDKASELAKIIKELIT